MREQVKRNKDINPKTVMYRKESIENITALNEDLAKEKWLDIFEENNVNIAYKKSNILL